MTQSGDNQSFQGERPLGVSSTLNIMTVNRVTIGMTTTFESVSNCKHIPHPVQLRRIYVGIFVSEYSNSLFYLKKEATFFNTTKKARLKSILQWTDYKLTEGKYQK